MRKTILILIISGYSLTGSCPPSNAPIPAIPKRLSASIVDAFIMVESSGDTLAFVGREQAVGCLQIRPIMINQVNKIAGYVKYTLPDAWSRQKSIEIFNLVMGYYKPKTVKEYCKIWNGKKTTPKYYQKIKREMEKLNINL